MLAGYDVSQIFLYRDHVDFRKSIDGLAAIVEMELRMNIFSGSLFLFVNPPSVSIDVRFPRERKLYFLRERRRGSQCPVTVLSFVN